MMKRVTFDPSKFHPHGILEVIRSDCCNLPNGVIAIDGWPGSGKSTFACWLGRETGISIIHLDDFFSGDPCEPSELMETRVQEELGQRPENVPVIIEGVCAGRICRPEIMVHFGDWASDSYGERLYSGLRRFIGSYDPVDHTGCLRTHLIKRHP